MPKQMIATFSDSAVNALQNGDAMFNNGFRASEGFFFPEQPVFSPMPSYSMISCPNVETILGIGACALGIGACGYMLFGIALPIAKRFAEEKIYPYLADKWDEKHSTTGNTNYTEQPVANKPYNPDYTDNDRIIPFDSSRRSA